MTKYKALMGSAVKGLIYRSNQPSSVKHLVVKFQDTVNRYV